MEQPKLIYSPVVFTENPHSYHLGDREYSGITSILKKYLFADMYNGVPEQQLEIARQRGSLVHEQIENVIIGMPNIDERPEVEFYRKLNIPAMVSEYTVSDDTFGIASKIDIVMTDCSLADIKTTSVLHKEYLQWQLSIYAYLFEKQNPGLKVPHLYAIHLKKDGGKKVEVTRLPDVFVESLLAAYASGAETFDNPMGTSAEMMLADNEEAIQKALELEDAINAYKQKKEQAENDLKELKEGLIEIMRQVYPDGGTYTFPNGTKLIYKKESETMRFSSTALKEADPDLYNQYLKPSTTAASLSIKKKK